MLLHRSGGGPAEYLIVGLGNPGDQYRNTRHNVGFMTVDRLAELSGASIAKRKGKALYGDARVGGHRCLLVKPQTFMNSSGEAVVELMRFFKLPPERVLIVSDDISLPVGRIRVRRKGSDGGHNGLKSILLLTGSEAFPRIKLGVGAKPRPDYDLAAWVLSSFRAEEEPALREAVEHACAAAALIVDGKIDRAMNEFNG